MSLRLYDLVKSVGAVSSRRLDRAAAEAGRTGAALSAILVSRGELEAAHLAELIARLLQVRRVSGEQTQKLSLLQRKVPNEYARKARLVLLTGMDAPVLAMSDPTDADARAVVESLTGQTVEVVVIDEDTLERILSRLTDATGSYVVDKTVAQGVPAEDYAFLPLATHVDVLAAHRPTSSIRASDDVATDATHSESGDLVAGDVRADADDATRVDARASDFASRNVPKTIAVASSDGDLS